jgi:photosystem II stability/assembly factor-like uncharacterized protein
MKVKLSLLLILIFTSYSFSQVNWYNQNSGVNRELTGVSFVDQNNGWVSGWTETMLHTTDGGQTWNPQTVPPNNAYYSVYFTDDQNGWASGYAGKMIHTTDGGQTWSSQTTPANTDLYKLYFIDSNTGWVVGGDAGTFPSYIPHRIILHTTNGGSSWSSQYYQSYKKLLKSVYFLDYNNGFATGPGGVFMHTTDGGNNWSEQTIAASFDYYDIFFMNSNTGWVVGEDLNLPHHSSIFNTTDGGVAWNETSLGTDEILTGIVFTDELKGWAIGNDWGNGNIGIIYRTTDGGSNWTYANIPSINSLAAVYFYNNTAGWAVGHLGTIVATVNPTPVELTSFIAIADNNNVTLNWKTATETNNSGFEVQRSDFRSQGPENFDWEKIGFIEGNGTSTNENDYSFADKNLETGNYSYRLIQIDFDGTKNNSDIVNVEVNSLPTQYSLKQNYPNPFNPTTKIEYSIPETGNVTLKVYNAIGEEVTTLVDNFETAGAYSVNFNASSLASGIYFYRIESGGFTEVHKMILLK